ncbi:unnamed protein product, partial [Mesorhabditis belari]|uniref:Uncharacterized protein n=1 Tax=Mesorhabditis belari TaxID=2138241 RepID=A0AAF3F927_9BILA
MTFKELNPILVANFLLVFTDFFYIITSTIHDNTAKIWEIETFGSIGVFIFLYTANIRYWMQIYLFFLISVMHLVAIYAPGHYRSLNLRWTFGLMAIPMAFTILTDTIYYTVCACLYYQIPGYYIMVIPERQEIEDKFEIYDAWLKITMLLLLIGTDAAIIFKLYKMNILGTKRKRFPEAIGRTGQTIATPSAIFIIEQSTVNRSTPKQPTNRSKISIDKRLAIAFTWISFAFILMTLYFRYWYIFPIEILQYTGFLVYNLEISKCVIYVLIVTKK